MIYVIGLGLEGAAGLGAQALSVMRRSGLIAGGSRHLEELATLAGVEGERFIITSDLQALEKNIRDFIKRNKRATVTVIATGDPLLYGIGNFILRSFGRRGVKVIPGVSLVHEAFARIKESSEGLKVLSLHGRPADFSRLSREISSNQSLALFTDSKNTPATVARGLMGAGLGSVKVYVCEALGYAEEKVRRGGLATIARVKKAHPLSIMIFLRGDDARASDESSLVPGLGDGLFRHSANMITKSEIRAVSLCKLAPARSAVIWDVGSCTGSVAIEAARLAPQGTVYAVEKNRKRVRDIKENVSRFNATNVSIITGEAPACLKGLPAPDAVFIGGGGGGITTILRYVYGRLRENGVIVVNAVTMETASRTLGFFKDKGMKRNLVQLNLTRGKEVAGLSILSASNPVFILKGVKGVKS
ncbi:MAG: precorrin-6y C5,15-methyltransferase (decarboxylating) subunit CbiE [Thermodesulfobacteriota bacterium]